MLQACGLTVLTASNGAEGVEIFKRSPEIDAVLLDMMMPEMDGATAFTKIHGIRPAIPVILMSGYNEQEATRRFVGQGLAGFLQKPYRPADLIRKLREVLS
jgi:CheY-like chemotaxis protein